jgi:hypothetical protein
MTLEPPCGDILFLACPTLPAPRVDVRGGLPPRPRALELYVSVNGPFGWGDLSENTTNLAEAILAFALMHATTCASCKKSLNLTVDTPWDVLPRAFAESVLRYKDADKSWKMSLADVFEWMRE